LARFKQEHIDVVLGEGSYLSRATTATNTLEAFEQDLSVAIAQRDLLRRELESIPETIPNASAGGPPDDTQYRIVELEAQLRQLLSQYTEKHPDVITTQRQLDALLAKQKETREALVTTNASLASDGDQAIGSPNPVYSQVKLQLIDIETQIENLRRRAAAARVQADALAAKAEDVPRVEAEYQRLNRDYGILKSQHDELLSRRESARVSRSRDDVGQQVQYRLIEPPIVPSKPTGPNRALFLMAVFVLAVGAGAGLALLLVILDTSFSTMVELRTYTGLPVLGSVSDTRRRSSHRAADTIALSLGAVGLVAVLAMLLALERQYGLDTLVAANGSAPGVVEQGVRLIVQKSTDILSWFGGLIGS
jgi:polysaccharide chain length determinant protein (PEP-CTERM system associated)